MAEGGRLIMPVGRRRGEQRLLRLVRSGDHYDLEDLGGVRFVPLVGEQGVGGRTFGGQKPEERPPTGLQAEDQEPGQQETKSFGPGDQSTG
jgi:hypothetical protein